MRFMGQPRQSIGLLTASMILIEHGKGLNRHNHQTDHPAKSPHDKLERDAP